VLSSASSLRCLSLDLENVPFTLSTWLAPLTQLRALYCTTYKTGLAVRGSLASLTSLEELDLQALVGSPDAGRKQSVRLGKDAHLPPSLTRLRIRTDESGALPAQVRRAAVMWQQHCMLQFDAAMAASVALQGR